MNIPAYAELRCISNFTFLRGASQPEELVERAKQLGLCSSASPRDSGPNACCARW
jgi:error-prone DNA polymerase